MNAGCRDLLFIRSRKHIWRYLKIKRKLYVYILMILCPIKQMYRLKCRQNFCICSILHVGSWLHVAFKKWNHNWPTYMIKKINVNIPYCFNCDFDFYYKQYPFYVTNHDRPGLKAFVMFKDLFYFT